MTQTSDADPFKGSELTTILVVSDIKRSLEFYMDKLNASLFREYGGNSAVIQFLGHWILLVTPGGPTEDKPSVHFANVNDPDRVDHSFTIRVADCNSSYNILKTRGVEFITPPYNWGYEVRCFFRDPDGHLLEISESKSTS